MRITRSEFIALVLGMLLVPTASRAEPAHPAAVSLRASGAGWYTVTPADGALYTYSNDKDHPGQSSCVGACAELWPPLVADAAAEPQGAWSLIKRADGRQQWAYRNSPVYTFSLDRPGTSYGDGHFKSWHVVFDPIDTPPGLKVGSSILGRVLLTEEDKAVYEVSDSAEAEGAAKRAPTWLPISAPWTAKANGPWSPAKRADGTLQWAFRRMPLFRAADREALPTAKSADRNLSHAIVLEEAPAVPKWVTIQHADMGPVFADATGKTLYRFFPANAQKLASLVCDAACIKANWKPVPAEPGAAPIGNWQPVSQPDGTRQWAYKGGLVFTFINDQRNGDAFGDKFGGMENPWDPILQASLIFSEP